LRIGLVGAGHLGKIHIQCLQKTAFDFIGFYDPDTSICEGISEKYGIKSFDTLESLLAEVDALDVVSPTKFHHEIAKKAIVLGKHVFIEKPLTETLEQAEELVALAAKHQVKVQVGHVERYNPAIKSIQNIDLKPKFIEAHRLAIFNPRGTDVSVVLDLMIHDIDIILSMVNSPIKAVYANGVNIVSDTADICNARIEFENGTVVNLTASRISMKNMRKIRIFQSDAYLSLDFLDKNAQIIKIEDTDDENSGLVLHTKQGLKRIIIDNPSIMQNNAILDELVDFYEALTLDTPVTVNIEAGLKALKLAYLIEEKISHI